MKLYSKMVDIDINFIPVNIIHCKSSFSSIFLFFSSCQCTGFIHTMIEKLRNVQLLLVKIKFLTAITKKLHEIHDSYHHQTNAFQIIADPSLKFSKFIRISPLRSMTVFITTILSNFTHSHN